MFESMLYKLYLSIYYMTTLPLLSPPVRPMRVVRWRLVATSLGKKIEEVNPLEPLPSEVLITPEFPVIEVSSHDWKKLRKKELRVPKPRSQPTIGGINGRGFGPRH
jgi:hypothetical protein